MKILIRTLSNIAIVLAGIAGAYIIIMVGKWVIHSESAVIACVKGGVLIVLCALFAAVGEG